MSAPTMLPTLRYYPVRDAVWVWPDRAPPFLVTRNAIEGLIGRQEPLPVDGLIELCEEHRAYLTAVAARKLIRGDVDPEGHAVVLALDVLI